MLCLPPFGTIFSYWLRRSHGKWIIKFNYNYYLPHKFGKLFITSIFILLFIVWQFFSRWRGLWRIANISFQRCQLMRVNVWVLDEEKRKYVLTRQIVCSKTFPKRKPDKSMENQKWRFSCNLSGFSWKQIIV
jgi:hypothetical protein